jgi:thiopurine S-methyltransferase
MSLNKDYWEERYQKNALGWDIGGISTPLKEYIDQLRSRDLKILIPGAGRGYEAEYLFRKGFHSVCVMDIAAQPLQDLKQRLPDFPEDQLLLGNFFELEGQSFDLILEQTFFCALLPAQREAYAKKMTELLTEKGTLAGLLFDFPLTEKGPPFGGSYEEYQALFSRFFTIKKLERATNSIPPRQGTELFFIFEKKSD